MSSSFECPVCFECNNDSITSILPCKHQLCLKCTLILNPSLCPLCRKDYTSGIEIINATILSYYNKVKDEYNNAPRFTPSDFPPLG